MNKTGLRAVKEGDGKKEELEKMGLQVFETANKFDHDINSGFSSCENACLD
jgi:hypothetical protein